jgi:hypothetical protein
MSINQDSSVSDNLFKQAEELGELKKEIKACDLPPHVKEGAIEKIDTKLEKLSKAIISLSRNK